MRTIIVLLIASALFLVHGVVLTQLWGWFIVPLGVPAISLAWAVGLSCVVGLVTPQPAPVPKDRALEYLGIITTKPFVVWAIGLVAHAFMRGA